MLEDSESLKNYHIVKFEEMIKDPKGTTEKLYKLSSLDISKVKKLRFRSNHICRKEVSICQYTLRLIIIGLNFLVYHRFLSPVSIAINLNHLMIRL